MFTFNRNEQIAILALTAVLIVGCVVSAVDYLWPDRIENFDVAKGAIPVPDPVPVEAEADLAEQPVDVNTASARELTRLPQIGPKTADRIIAHREANGPFASPDDLAAVRGIGPRTVDKLRPLVTFSTP